MKNFCLGLGTAALLFVGSSVAALTVDISGTAGSGTTTWIFSGSQTANGDGAFGNLGSDTIPDFNSQFADLGDFAISNLLVAPVLSGDAAVTVEGGTTNTLTIENVLVDDDGDSDDLGFDFGGPTLSFMTGDLVTFSGSAVVDLDLSELSASGLPFFASTSGSSGGLNSALSLDLSITETSAVPLPAGLPLLLLGIGALGAAGARRRKG